MDGEMTTCTSEGIWSTMDSLARDPELRKQVEEEMRSRLPEGYTFYINSSGFGYIGCPLMIQRTESKNG